MKFSQVVSCLPAFQLVTVANYLSGYIYVDCESADSLIHSKFKDFRVYKIEVGEGCYPDIIVSILEND